ncbi:uncharacterized protein LOC112560764 [Pomacea canaliculata]|uniref:uncharacterized protein LOC112560764 n=1 Tax=Pomacea canaliculata TaxID=400727 RepID=UPI000D73C7C0|nr:uncharacterized protein LOC112560764 [Pomacea canaliculata]
MRNVIQSIIPILLLTCPSPADSTATFRLEAESLLSTHATRFRTSASGGRTVYSITPGEELIFPVCLYQPVLADVTVRYSNDGGSDVVKVKVDNVVAGSILTFAESKGGYNWEVMREETVYNVSLGQGLRRLAVEFSQVDAYGVEVDCLDVTVYDDFLNQKTFDCSLALAGEPQIGKSDTNERVKSGYVEQHSYVTTCPEEDNVHLAAYHDSVVNYTITATNPLYRSYKDYKEPDFSTCPRLQSNYWHLEDVRANDNGSIAQGNETNTVTVSTTSYDDIIYSDKIAITFTLKGISDGFIDAEFRSILEATFVPVAGSTARIRVAFVRKNGKEEVLDEFSSDYSVSRKWTFPEMTWSGNQPNVIYVYVSQNVIIQRMELRRDSMRPDTATVMYSNDAIILQGFDVDFWWRKPAGESLTIQVGNKYFTDFSYFALYVATPWNSKGGFQQLLVIYQDGNVRLLPPPPSSPVQGQWVPFGTSILLGKSKVSDPRPSAPIRTIQVDPATLSMALTYYDGSSCSITLTYSPVETVLHVNNVQFGPSTSGPFATFRSMFVEFGKADADSLQSDLQGPVHAMGRWTAVNGSDFLLYRRVESYHNTQSPDIRLTIRA